MDLEELIRRLKRDHSVFVYYRCPEGLGIVRRERTIPMSILDVVVIDERNGIVFDKRCYDCYHGEWIRKGLKKCRFVMVEHGEGKEVQAKEDGFSRG